MPPPLIGITVDNRDNTVSSGRYESSITYSRAVARAGGLPVLLPHVAEIGEPYVAACDGLVLTGGVDPRTEDFNEPTHPEARPMDPRRQAFELTLLEAVRHRPPKCVLGVCLGMQLMALHAGGRLDQYLPDTLPDSDIHRDDRPHGIALLADDSVLCPGAETNFEGRQLRAAGPQPEVETPGRGVESRVAVFMVISHHQQAVADPGRLRIVARAPDGVIEAIDDPSRPFYLGVQWHPERGPDPDPSGLNQGLFDRLVRASARAT